MANFLKQEEDFNKLKQTKLDEEYECQICKQEYPLRNGLLCSLTNIFYPFYENEDKNDEDMKTLIEDYNRIPHSFRIDPDQEITDLFQEYHDRINLLDIRDKSVRHFTCDDCICTMIPLQIAGEDRVAQFCQTKKFRCCSSEPTYGDGIINREHTDCIGTYNIIDIYAHMQGCRRIVNRITTTLVGCGALRVQAAPVVAAAQEALQRAERDREIQQAERDREIQRAITRYEEQLRLYNIQEEKYAKYVLELRNKDKIRILNRIETSLPVLQVDCPHCRTPFLGFSGCFAVSCSQCHYGFCAWCMVATFESDRGRANLPATHAHVSNCPYNPRRGDYFGTIGEYYGRRMIHFQQLFDNYIARSPDRNMCLFIVRNNIERNVRALVRSGRQNEALNSMRPLIPDYTNHLLRQYNKQWNWLFEADSGQPLDFYNLLTVPEYIETHEIIDIKELWNYHKSHPRWLHQVIEEPDRRLQEPDNPVNPRSKSWFSNWREYPVIRNIRDLLGYNKKTAPVERPVEARPVQRHEVAAAAAVAAPRQAVDLDEQLAANLALEEDEDWPPVRDQRQEVDLDAQLAANLALEDEEVWPLDARQVAEPEPVEEVAPVAYRRQARQWLRAAEPVDAVAHRRQVAEPAPVAHRRQAFDLDAQIAANLELEEKDELWPPVHEQRHRRQELDQVAAAAVPVQVAPVALLLNDNSVDDHMPFQTDFQKLQMANRQLHGKFIRLVLNVHKGQNKGNGLFYYFIVDSSVPDKILYRIFGNPPEFRNDLYNPSYDHNEIQIFFHNFTMESKEVIQCTTDTISACLLLYDNNTWLVCGKRPVINGRIRNTIDPIEINRNFGIKKRSTKKNRPTNTSSKKRLFKKKSNRK